MRLFSYTIARDYGFAPNPFHGFCTLGTCKPQIRATAKEGDWIAGISGAKEKRAGKIVYAMKVTERMTFQEYWDDPRFQCKKPYLHGSLTQGYGDNIYHRDENNQWIQEDSHHSLTDGAVNLDNLDTDTRIDQVLVSNDFYYWGCAAQPIPAEFKNWEGRNLYVSRPVQNTFPEAMVLAFEEWCRKQPESGLINIPFRFHSEHGIPMMGT